ncbi:MAG: hypothetical protein P8X68_20045 [Desulfobacterales bacterium]|jgi:hypothetical protein
MNFKVPLSMVISLIAFFSMVTPADVVADDKYQKMINCDLHKSSCSQTLSENTVTLEVTPRPVKAMQDLSFKISLTANLPSGTKPPYIDLGMPGMKMGPNRVHLKSTGNNTYEGRGVIVKCPSGRRIWRATVIIPGMGQTDFIFDVIY